MPILELANSIHVSKSTVHRFCKKIGFKGFNELKIAIVKEISKGLQEQKELIPNAKRYKDKNGNYKYFVERKK